MNTKFQSEPTEMKFFQNSHRGIQSTQATMRNPTEKTSKLIFRQETNPCFDFQFSMLFPSFHSGQKAVDSKKLAMPKKVGSP